MERLQETEGTVITEGFVEAAAKAHDNLLTIGAHFAAHVLGMSDLPTHYPMKYGTELDCETECPVYIEARDNLAQLEPNYRQPVVE